VGIEAASGEYFVVFRRIVAHSALGSNSLRRIAMWEGTMYYEVW
jgi:hypothetical protein